MQLTTLEVKFDRYSIPSELFTNVGLIELTERCTALTHLSLRNTNITDRALYAVAANCKRLSSLRLGGYHECISDAGMTILVSACSATLNRLQLSSKLTRVSDVTTQYLVSCGDRLPYTVAIPADRMLHDGFAHLSNVQAIFHFVLQMCTDYHQSAHDGCCKYADE